VAKKLYALEAEFFTGGIKKRTLKALEPYYAAIRAAAAQISNHHEKQTFLKVIYENFYKVYNRKAADRLGVIYTPNEIVRFMIENADWLCERHFGKRLIDKDVEILDPAVGTGTFITELIEHFRGQPAKLRYKYLEELHANEVAILPYYVANLNIEATYAAINGYEEYPNLCFVDTLDNTAALRAHIRLDGETQLTGVPPQAWTYRLGNRSALEWILDQYKEKTPKDPTIREKFNTYRFADHKEKVIDLIKRVTRVSVETMKIVEKMRAEQR
jgi:predicted helicase